MTDNFRAAVEMLAERAARKGYDLDPHDVLDILDAHPAEPTIPAREIEALADEWDRTADECVRLAPASGDEAELRTAGAVNRKRAATLHALVADARGDQ